MSINEQDSRINKLQELKNLGINPYPEKFDKKNDISEVLKMFDESTMRSLHEIQESPNNLVATAGRIMLMRPHWSITFAKIKGQHGEIQIMFDKKNTKIIVWEWDNGVDTINDQNAYKIVQKYFDVGDWIGIKWEPFKTMTGEKTIFANQIQLLSKSLLPLGEKFHGIEDADMKIRKRYLTIIHDDAVKEMLIRRSKFRNTIRSFLLEWWFLEVDTPILENTTGGADANPFVTHHNALDIDVNLRISCGELRQKRLMVAGFEKTFEIGRIFRNEGMSAEHAQDYTQMENYWAFADYKQMMELIKNMYLKVIDTVYGKRTFTIKWYEVNFNDERKEIDYSSTIKEMTGIDIFYSTEEEIIEKLKTLRTDGKTGNRARLVDSLWKYCRKDISGPAFLVNVPTFVSPLAKSKQDNPALTNRFQIVIAGSEVGNGFSELNDPIDQRNRFQEQQDMRDAWDPEAQMADREYVEALEHGMPPAAGFGVSDRLFSFLEDLPIRETHFFTLNKPAKEE